MVNGTDLVIFDCDGVLVDSERVSLDVALSIAADFGWALTADAFVDFFVGSPAAVILAVIEGELGSERAAQFLARFWQDFTAELERRLTPVEGIFEALDWITSQTSMRICVASNSGHEHIKGALTRTRLYDRFEGRVFSAHDVEHGKPAPDLFLHAAATLGIEPERCAVVEDSRAGVQAARAAGMRSFGYGGGVTPGSWLEGVGTVVFSDMQRLPELLGDRRALS
ncbi:MAG: HAD family hydrolase [Catenulispora sp.]